MCAKRTETKDMKEVWGQYRGRSPRQMPWQMKKRKKIRGYFSVEAALVLPVVLGVYLFLIVTLFIQYDRCLLEQDMASMLIKAGNYAQSPQKRLEYLQELTLSWDRGQYLWIQPQPPHFSLQGQRICLEAAGEYTLPYGALVMPNGSQRIEMVFSLNTWDRTVMAKLLAGREEERNVR